MEPLLRDYGDLLGDDRVRRFLLACKGDEANARQMIEKHLEWRKVNKADDVRLQMRGKAFLVSSLPHARELKERGLGLSHSVLNAGRDRFGRDVVHLEVMGNEGQDLKEERADWLDKVMENYIGFFERRNQHLEDLTTRERRLVRTVQIRDVSNLALMPGGAAFSMVKKVLTLGMANYPECGTCAIFLNPPKLFDAVFSIVKRWIPSELNRKLKFYSGEAVGRELLRHVKPASIVALQRLVLENEESDSIAYSLEPTEGNWEKTFDLKGTARAVEFLYFVLSEKKTRAVGWRRLVTDDDETYFAKSRISAKILHVRKGTSALPTTPDEVIVDETVIGASDQYAVLPPQMEEGLLVLKLDHQSTSWARSRAFKLRVVGREQPELKIERLVRMLKDEIEESVYVRTAADQLNIDVLERFLQANGLDVTRAYRHLHAHLLWRGANGIDGIGAASRAKPFLLSSLPHCQKLRSFGLVSTQCVLHAQFSRTGDVVQLEVLEDILTGDTESPLDSEIADYYAGLFEMRNALLESMQSRNGFRPRFLEIVDAGGLQSMASRTAALGRCRKIVEMCARHYPNTCSAQLVIDQSREAGFAMTNSRKALPGFAVAPMHEFCGDPEDSLRALLAYVSPTVIVALECLRSGLEGDSITKSLASDTFLPCIEWSLMMQRPVKAGQRSYKCFAMKKSKTRRIAWCDVNGTSAAKSVVRGTMFYVRADQERDVPPEEVIVERKILGHADVADLGSVDAREALLVLCLDHSASWIYSHDFAVEVKGYGS